MGKAELFSYLSAFVTIVLALAITNILQSASLLIQSRRAVRWDLRPILFALTVFIALVSEFFSLWSNLSVAGVTMPRLLWLITIPSLFAVLAYSALPNSVPDGGIDLGSFFESERRLWSVLFATIAVLDIVRNVEATYRYGVPVVEIAWWALVSVVPIMLPAVVAFALLYRSASRLRHWIALGILFAWVMAGTLVAAISVTPAA